MRPADPEPFATSPQPLLSQELSASAQAAGSNQKEVSFVERFIAAFFHESNIKWMLFVGAAIVTVSFYRS